jgi:hypothetical protein
MSGPAARADRPTAARLGWAAAVALAVCGAAAGQSPDPDRYKIDSDRFQFTQVRDGVPVRSESENRDEYETYNDVLLHARQFTADELERAAYRDVTFADLLGKARDDYRFKLLYFEGRLKRLRRMEPTRPLAAAGVKDLYEAWVFPRNGTDPMCVLTTELPPGLESGPTDFEPARPVAVAGYFFKVISYEATEKDPKDPTRQRRRLAPLLMAKSLTLLPEPEADGGRAWRTGFLPGMLGVMAAIAAVVLGLTFWFRRGDRAARRALDRRDRNPFEGEPGAEATG